MLPQNILKQVITYNDSGLAYLENLNCLISTTNKKFMNFQDTEKQLGDTVQFDVPPRSIAMNGLVASFQSAQQRFGTIVCDQAANSSMAFTAQQFVFNVHDYMEKFGMSRVEELSAKIEKNVGRNADSSVPVMTVNSDGQSVPTGALHTESGPYRFYGDGVTQINSFQQLASMLALNAEYGVPAGAPDVYLPNLAIPGIVGSGLNQFVPARNEEFANSWDLGTYKGSNARYYRSNLLPIHRSGSVGNDALTLTVVSTDDPTGANINNITLSGANVSDALSILSGDLGQFVDGVAGFNDMRYLTWTGHEECGVPVQVRALATAGSNGGGQVTINVFPPLQSTIGPNQNLNQNIQAGMKMTFLPDHRCGMVVSGKALYLAMPKLPDEVPFPTSTQTNKATGASLRLYYGTLFGKNTRGLINDAIWGSYGQPEYMMRIAFPLNFA
jgi:hypothetical protein